MLGVCVGVCVCVCAVLRTMLNVSCVSVFSYCTSAALFSSAQLSALADLRVTLVFLVLILVVVVVIEQRREIRSGIVAGV